MNNDQKSDKIDLEFRKPEGRPDNVHDISEEMKLVFVVRNTREGIKVTIPADKKLPFIEAAARRGYVYLNDTQGA